MFIGEPTLENAASLNSQGTNASNSSARINIPIKRPKGRYWTIPVLRLENEMFNIITTNKNKTASAPTYTIISISAKNSAPSNMKNPDTPKKDVISQRTEWTGLFAKITNTADSNVIPEKK